jgi:phenylalanyl-tRNA synthetase beta chain
MRVPVSWLRELVELPADLTPTALDAALSNLGIAVESIVDERASVQGDLVVGRVASVEELTGFNRPIRWCTVDVGTANGTGQPQGVICGARNFAAGDLVVVILPGGVLPGGMQVGARRTYGRVSNGMICSARELGIGDDHSGILVLDPDSGATPGEDARPYVGLDDIVVDVEITPDRGYQLSVRGLARELSHAYGSRFTDPGIGKAPKGTRTPAWPVTVVDQAGCDRFAARLVRGLDPAAPTPVWMQRRLLTAGVRTLGLAIDITNYVMLELGQPMHAFDADRIAGSLVVRRATAGERLTTLDGVERELAAEDMVICDDTGPVSLAAVMGGQTSEVVPGTTTDVLFEAAHWDPTMVGRTARRHRLFSEAAKRWERGVDRELCLIALRRAVELAQAYGGPGVSVGKAVLDLDYPGPVPQITLDAARPGRLIGVAYPTERVVQVLTEVGCTVTVTAATGADPAGAGETLVVTPPSWRPDLLAPADLTEEVVRLDGFDRVPSILPAAGAGSGLTAAQRRRRSVGRTLAEQGFVEVLSYPFVSAQTLALMDLPAGAVRLANPLSEQEPYMRTSLLPPLLAALRRNVGRGQRDVALYELGTVFLPAPQPGTPRQLELGRPPTEPEWREANAAVPHQPWHVAAAVTGEVEPAGPWGAGRAADWSDAVRAALDTLSAAGVAAAAVRVRSAAYGPWHPGRCAEISVGDDAAGYAVVGYAGELHPAVCSGLELPRRTCAMELDLDAVPLPATSPAPVISTFPPALVDVALVVDNAVPAASVEAALVAGAGELLESVRLFDVYTGAPVQPGQRSLAYTLVLRAPDRTLTADETLAARDAAVAAAGALGAVLRG